MTTFLLAAMLTSASLSTPDPKPIAMDSTAYQIGVQRITVCENGVCRIVEMEVPDAAPLNNAPSARAADCGCGASCACGTAAVASSQSRPRILDRVRSWYPGKLFQTFRANLAALRGR